MKEQGVMDLKQAATRLGVTRNTIFNMANRGLLRIIRKPFGRPRYFVPVEDIEQLERAEPDIIGRKVSK